MFFRKVIIVVALVIRTVGVIAPQKTVHLVLVKIDETGVIFIVLVVNVINTFFAV